MRTATTEQLEEKMARYQELKDAAKVIEEEKKEISAYFNTLLESPLTLTHSLTQGLSDKTAKQIQKLVVTAMDAQGITVEFDKEGRPGIRTTLDGKVFQFKRIFWVSHSIESWEMFRRAEPDVYATYVEEKDCEKLDIREVKPSAASRVNVTITSQPVCPSRDASEEIAAG